MKLTDLQTRLARSALGLVNGRTVSYRNRFTAARYSLHEIAWEDLVRQGLAVRSYRSPAMVGFSLTEDGARAVLHSGETLDPEDFPAGRAALEREGE